MTLAPHPQPGLAEPPALHHLMDRSALVLFSGGQDSTTCLFWALSPVMAASTTSRPSPSATGSATPSSSTRRAQIAEAAGVPFSVLDLTGLLSGSALLAAEADKTRTDAHELAPDLPASFVPGRNALFLTAAASHAFTRGIHDLVGGMCQTDYSGYPDCRLDFIESQARTLMRSRSTPKSASTRRSCTSRRPRRGSWRPTSGPCAASTCWRRSAR